ncbi:MAG: cation diffusion facilitator family transporter [Erysipelotrichaceae bacterium]|nr:cation diffusion facilitator family transporter [Erysipelotrichaceae bacterium]
MKNQSFEKVAVKVSLISIIGNFVLSGLKLLAGFLAHSGAMISDAVHSASDVFSSIVVLIGIKLSSKDSDKEHPYGHDRLECVAAIVLAIMLLVTGLFIGHGAIEKLSSGNLNNLEVPGALALVAAIVSIACKEAMYWYTRFYAKAYDSNALMADAWHHRSDALSSIGALIGIYGARKGYAWLDAAASLVICLFIAKAAYDIFVDAIEKMVDHSLSAEEENKIKECVLKNSDVKGLGELTTREFGNKAYVDIEILLDGSLSLKQSHLIRETIHEDIEKVFPKIKHINIHIRPF